MSQNILYELNLESLRKKFLKYTQTIFERLPKLEKPRILDVGCGSGVPTIRLAELSDAEVIGIDIDQKALDELNRKIKEEGLSNQIQTRNCSLLELNLPNDSFDIIWAEGVLDIIGYNKSFQACHRLLTANGFLILHDQVSRMERELKNLDNYGFKLIDSFPLPEDAWWVEYYNPLEIRIKKLRKKYENDSDAQMILEKSQREVDMFK